MASVIARKRADGTTVYKADIKIKQGGKVVHRETKTFDKAKLARDWGMRREIELQETQVYKKQAFLSIHDLLARYLQEFPPTGKSKRKEMKALMERKISALNVHTLTTKDLIAHIRDRNQECSPQTAANDLIWLNVAIKTMKGLIDIDVDLAIFDSARKVLKAEKLIAKSTRRDRLPTREELWKLSRFFHGTTMFYVIWFAIYSARRQSEIVRIQWTDIAHTDKTCIVRDLKDPRLKGVNKRFKIPASAYKIIMKQPQGGRYVFPMRAATICKYFTDACHLLRIEDLHFHDLRHLATTHLFNRGYSIQDVQHITLHSSWETLRRYCNTNPGDVDV